MSGIGQSFNPALSKAVWDFDDQMFEQALNGIAINKIITGVKLVSPSGSL